MDLFTDDEGGEDVGAYLGLDLDLSGSLEELGARLSDARISAGATADSPRTSEGGSAVGGSEVAGQGEERSAEEPTEADRTRRSEEEEEASAREKAAQRRRLAIEELVYTERNYLRLLQLASVTIRNNLQKIQVAGGHGGGARRGRGGGGQFIHPNNGTQCGHWGSNPEPYGWVNLLTATLSYQINMCL